MNFDNVILSLLTIAILLLAAILLFGLVSVITIHEIKSYSVDMVVSNMDYAATRSAERYRMGVRNGELYASLVIDEWEYGKYSEGDVVEVQVRIMEDIFGQQYNEFYLLGYSLEEFK